MKITLFLPLALLALAACGTTREIPAPSSGWNTYHGQLRYSGDGKPIIGEVVIRTGANRNLEAEFLSGPGFPLLRARSDASYALAEGAIAQGRWRGRVGKPPVRMTGWFMLYDVFEEAATRSGNFRGEGWTAHSTREGGKLKTLDILIAASGERFQFDFGG